MGHAARSRSGLATSSDKAALEFWSRVISVPYFCLDRTGIGRHDREMGRMKTLCLLLGLWAWMPNPAQAAPSLAENFARCAGRLSAQLEHEWLMRSPKADGTKAVRNAFADLLAAVAGPSDAVLTLALRIEAKQAHAALLRRAQFNAKTDDAARAARFAQLQVRACLRLLPETDPTAPRV